MVVYDHDILVDLYRAVAHLADTYTADIFIVVYRTYEHLCAFVKITFGRRYVINDRLEERYHRLLKFIRRGPAHSVLCRCIDERTVKLFIARIKIHEQFEHLVDNLLTSCFGSVDLVDTHEHGKL